MAKERKPIHKVVMTEGKRDIIRQLLQKYDIQTAEDIQDALKDLLGGTIKEMMEVEMDNHLGYEKSQRSDSDDYRNGYKSKRINSSYGSMDIQVPQDRKSTFEPQVVRKRQKDISEIDQKIISMYAKGMTTRQISDTLMNIYGFEASEGFISNVTDKILTDRGLAKKTLIRGLSGTLHRCHPLFCTGQRCHSEAGGLCDSWDPPGWPEGSADHPGGQ